MTRSSPGTVFHPVRLSLEDILGSEHVHAAATARARLAGGDPARWLAVASEKVDFFPRDFQERLLALLPRVGSTLREALPATPRGATTLQFQANTRPELAPLSTLGYFRHTEDGRLFLTAKSEHYHASLGHGFPGYALLAHARDLGIPNATHNNTRGFITRLLEEELIRAAAGIPQGDRAALDRILSSDRPSVLNRIINLETGSIAAEAALKMLLSRFYRPQPDAPPPAYAGRTPVLLVLGDDSGGLAANYHGTTLLTQALRGMWPEIACGLEEQGVMLIRGVKPGDSTALEECFKQYDTGRFKVGGFFLELVLMNYGARRLEKGFVARLAALCQAHDAPLVIDEIQTGIWSPRLFLFLEYGIRPDFVVIGKGFPGGEFAASRVIFSSAMDSLPQFGALVTSGQEELASLAYLVTIRWAEANADVTSAVGEYYEERLHELAARFPTRISHVDGRRHLAGIFFHDLETARSFARALTSEGIDISVQTYKEGCPPSALTKLPLLAGYEVVDLLLERMAGVLERS